MNLGPIAPGREETKTTAPTYAGAPTYPAPTTGGGVMGRHGRREAVDTGTTAPDAAAGEPTQVTPTTESTTGKYASSSPREER